MTTVTLPSSPKKGIFVMLWPALRALSHGELNPEQLRWLLVRFQLEEAPRTEGPGAKQSIAHRSMTDASGTRLILDLARTGESGWVFTLFYAGHRPSAGTVENHRAMFRDAVDQLGLTLIEISPAATVDEVLVTPPAPPGAESSAIGAHWALPDNLAHVWPHLGLHADAPQEVKEVKLRELMRTPAWSSAPTALHHQAEEFLRGD
jgi:hypothetical protein